MKPDWITKSLLLAIALFLGIIALDGSRGTGSAAVAQRTPVAVDQKFGHIQFSGDQDGFYLFDKASGRIWFYSSTDFRARPNEIGKLEQPGERLAR
jgi:hypothetical protein